MLVFLMSLAHARDIGWWVGWVVKNDRIFSFVLNIDIPDKGYLPERIELGKTCLSILGII